MKYVILCKSEILGRFVPSAWPQFNSFGEAETFAKKQIKGTEFEISAVTVKG